MACRLGLSFLGAWAGKNLSSGVVQPEQPFGDGQADGAAGEALAERVQLVGGGGAVGVPPAFGDDVTVPEQHEAVQVLDGALGAVDEGSDGGAGNALGFGGGAGEDGHGVAPGMRGLGILYHWRGELATGEGAVHRWRRLAEVFGDWDVECRKRNVNPDLKTMNAREGIKTQVHKREHE